MLVPLLPLLQTDADVSIWSWAADPGVAFGVTAAAWYYFRRAGRSTGDGVEPISRARRISFAAGLATIVLALMSPIGVLADDYLLSFHMLQHVMLTIAAPVLLLLGIPDWMYAPVTRAFGGRLWRVWRVLTLPVLAFVLFHLPYSIYHVPAVYDLSLQYLPIHIAAHTFLLLVAMISWWPVLAPSHELGKAAPAVAMVYLFVQTIPGQIVGAFITFADDGIYPTYADAGRVFGLSIVADQQLGGMIMWIGTSTIYLAAVTIVFFRWASREDRAHERHYAGA
ncbi:MAG: cytochrome c oxidase assembly protein [Thermomicrobiales bacterium]